GNGGRSPLSAADAVYRMVRRSRSRRPGGFAHATVGHPLAAILRGTTRLRPAITRRPRPVATALRRSRALSAVLRFGQGGIGLAVDFAEELGQALVELLEHHRAQAGREVGRLEQAD